MSTTQRSMSRAWSILGRAVRSKTYINNLSLSKIRKSTLLARKSSLKTPRFQNTYRLEACKPLKSEVIDMILIDVMQDYLTGVKYHPQIQNRSYHVDRPEVRAKRANGFWQIMGR
ncbi:PREDICTED: uncharacterized protein LOC105456664 isoform X5 [Wasmannia auropunctata]|uniref:uncharacterized protein LOC105456664 isoform X5 n=1 Tax=Wasmannia auropunctata TaxID=64793 RepID=UPI0005F066D6|nr:PREDICTED: uncharacterized protein LOC105456664 isoform X5 [Wasmannia auropunctata]